MRSPERKKFLGKSLITVLLFAAAFFCGELAAKVKTERAEETVPVFSDGSWGLSFPEEGEAPVGNVSSGELEAYDAYYRKDTKEKVLYLTFDCGYENGNTVKILDALKKQKDRGLTEFAGISLNLQAHADDGETADCLQVPASILDHRFDHCFGKPGRHCFIRGAYMQGMLLMPEDKIFIPEVLERRRRLEKLGIPMAELALRYLFSKPENKSILTGVETVAQLRENIRISRLSPLNETDLKRIDEIVFPPLPENCVSPFFWGKYKKEHNIA